MSDDPPSHLDGFLYYLYTMNYPDQIHDEHVEGLRKQHPDNPENLECSGTKSSVVVLAADWTWDLQLWKIADKYSVPRLMALARKEMLEIDLGGSAWYALSQLPGFVAMMEMLGTTGSSVASTRLRKDLMQKYVRVVQHISREPLLQQLVIDNSDLACEFFQVAGDNFANVDKAFNRASLAYSFDRQNLEQEAKPDKLETARIVTAVPPKVRQVLAAIPESERFSRWFQCCFEISPLNQVKGSVVLNAYNDCFPGAPTLAMKFFLKTVCKAYKRIGTQAQNITVIEDFAVAFNTAWVEDDEHTRCRLAIRGVRPRRAIVDLNGVPWPESNSQV